MTVVKGGYADHVLSLLGLAMGAIKREMAVDGAGRAGVAAAAGGLRSSQLRLLSMTPEDGLSVTALADRVGMTKQALGEFANDLEAKGFLESLRDPADRRVRILRPTEAGLAAVVDGDRLVREAEARWRAKVGDEDWDRLREILLRVHEQGRQP